MVSLPVPAKKSSQQGREGPGPWRSEATWRLRETQALPAEKTTWLKAWRLV